MEALFQMFPRQQDFLEACVPTALQRSGCLNASATSLKIMLQNCCMTSFPLCRIPRNVLKRGNVQKQESKAQYSEVFAVGLIWLQLMLA